MLSKSLSACQSLTHNAMIWVSQFVKSLCVYNSGLKTLKSKRDWLTDLLTDWQGHLLTWTAKKKAMFCTLTRTSSFGSCFSGSSTTRTRTTLSTLASCFPSLHLCLSGRPLSLHCSRRCSLNFFKTYFISNLPRYGLQRCCPWWLWR